MCNRRRALCLFKQSLCLCAMHSERFRSRTNHYQIFIKTFVRFDMDWFVFGVRLFRFIAHCYTIIRFIFHVLRCFRCCCCSFFLCFSRTRAFSCICINLVAAFVRTTVGAAFNQGHSINISNHYLFRQYFTLFSRSILSIYRY